MTFEADTSAPGTCFPFVVSKPPNPMSFIISISSSDFPSIAASGTEILGFAALLALFDLAGICDGETCDVPVKTTSLSLDVDLLLIPGDRRRLGDLDLLLLRGDLDLLLW